MQKRVIVAGSRSFDDYQMLEWHLNLLLWPFNDNPEEYSIEIVSGTARGADKLGERYAQLTGYNVTRFPANWNTHGRAAGYIRNEEMAKYADMAVLFWDDVSRGTKHMIDLCKKHDIPCCVIHYNGKPETKDE